MFKKLYAYLLCNSGVTGIEYGLIAGTAGLTIMTSVFVLGNDVSDVFETFSDYLNAEFTSNQAK